MQFQVPMIYTIDTLIYPFHTLLCRSTFVSSKTNKNDNNGKYISKNKMGHRPNA